MSLPTAPRDISENPQAGAVTDPVNKQQKDADVDRKLRFYGVIEAFREGRLPDNQQIDETLRYVKDNAPMDVGELSPEGQRLVQDVRDIVDTARAIVAEKNADELFQNFLWHTRAVDASRAKQDPNSLAPVDKNKATSDGQQAVTHLRTLLTLVLTNAETRKLLGDFALIGRDLFARGAVKAAELSRPDQERLARVDDPAPADQFHTAGGQTTTAQNGDTPVLEANVAGRTIQQHPHEPLGTGAKIRGPGPDDRDFRTGEQAKQDARGFVDSTKQAGKEQAQREKDDIRVQTEETNAEVDAREDPNEKKEVLQKSGLKDKFVGYRDQIMNRVPQEHKDKASEHHDRVKTFLSEEYFPEERRDQFIFRGKKVIVECQRHDDYQQAVRWLLGFLEEYAGHAHTASSKGADSHDALRNDPSLQQALAEIRMLLERFANGRSFSEITDRIQVLYDDAHSDEALRNWFKEVDSYARRCLLEPGFVLQPQCNDIARKLQDTGRQFYDGKYKSHFDAVFDAIGSFFSAMGDDPLNARFGQDWARLTKDLLFDSEGSLKFKPELWHDIRKVILPAVIDKVGYIPIPRVEYTDDSLDLVLENLTLSGRNLFPNIVTLEAHNFVKFSPYDAISDEHHHEITLHLGHIQADMRDVAFYFNKKTGIPKIKDSGLADVILGGEGLSATVHLVSAQKDPSSVYKVKNVNVKVDSLKFSIRDSKHDTLYNTLRPLATGLVKKQIQKALSGALTTGLEYVDGQLVGVRDRMNEAKASDEGSRTKVLQDLFHRKKDEGASKAESSKSARHSQFKVVAKRDSVLIHDQGHPAGWVNRQQERADAAKDGHEWRSKAFSIV
ncbi:uncharacterized protein FOMMEDRAFT_16402 [Fomitiporia mediterranea MF3/22]|uniref:uncharacterized protein n=1 Tax=Fomitiporia mediterranea (strain MF3/22) TaxID=694068 RepID=UPI0004408837|nr:uncharacterized protein FOMMEDRAFT_16402 [Fomitiporia mediterranea MF3/22]EJD07781.1 hypothetical protein FOMMEDRAFT_16402 [Fomitiporia mediterranea MF3/22]